MAEQSSQGRRPRLKTRKRKWVYVQPPADYGIYCDKCNGSNIFWSEFEHMIWCCDCKIDTPGNPGVFGGPIPINAAGLMGMSFDRINLRTGKVMKFRVKSWKKAQG